MNKALHMVLAGATASVLLSLTVMQAAAEDPMPAGVIELDETVISGNQELPKVLYIVPWRQPEGMPEIELGADFTEVELFRRLYPPAHRRELGYHEALRAGESNESDSRSK